MKKHAKAWLKGLIQYGIGFGLLGLFIYLYWDDTPAKDGRPASPGLGTLLAGPIQFGWLAAAAVLMACTLCLHWCRWFVLVRALDLPFTLRNAFRLGMVGLFYNTFLPGSVGGDLVKAYFIARAHPERKTRAVATVIADRALGLLGLILFVAVVGWTAWALGDPIISGNPKLQWMVRTMGFIGFGSVLGFLLLGFLPQRRVDRFASRLKWIPKVGGSLAELWYVVWMYRQRFGTVVICVGITALSHVALVGAFHCASRVFPPDNPADLVTWPEHAIIAPIGFIVQAVPISPGGVGVGEGVFAWLYSITGRPETRGLIARLSLRITEWILGMLGYLMYLQMKAHHELPEEENGNEEENGTGPPAKDPGKAAETAPRNEPVG